MMAKQETTFDAPAHTPGTAKGEERLEDGAEPGRDGGEGRTARDSTSINADKRGPIDPEMPIMPPA